MIKYYHTTSYKNLESIAKNGLVPQIGSRTSSIGDKRYAIFLSQGIKNTIMIYGSLLSHYNSFSGSQGLKAIRFYEDKIKSYEESANEIPLDEEDLAEIEATVHAIEWIKQIMEYKDFAEYIGDGVYLVVSDVSEINSDNPKDCYTTKPISPEKIKVVLLKNKDTGEIVDFREYILAYFMSITPINNIIDNLSNVVNIKVIRELYDSKLSDIEYYNEDNFEIAEVPIETYLSNYKETEEIVRGR